MTRVSQLWDLIETWGFREDIVAHDDANNNNNDHDHDDNNNNDGNDDNGISALGLDRDMGLSRG